MGRGDAKRSTPQAKMFKFLKYVFKNGNNRSSRRDDLIIIRKISYPHLYSSIYVTHTIFTDPRHVYAINLDGMKTGKVESA